MQTNRLAEMRDWYCTVLSAKPAFENKNMAFLAYDEEHHRVGLLSLEDYAVRERATVGLQHFSFTYDTLWTLLENYERLKAENILPAWTVNHGPTISMYYADPDGNQVELQWDVFETNEEVDAFINGPIYQTNPRGVDFDPEEMFAQVRAGTSFEVLTRRTH
jgi:catechol-2,3-dioxygenase